MKKTIIALALLGLSFGCTKKNDPENALRDYVNYRFSSGQSKGKLLDMTSGELNMSLQQMTDEQYEQFSNVDRYKKGQLNISLKKCTDEVCYITYTLKYEVVEEGNKLIDAEIKKVAKLISDEGVWKVADVSNVKTYFDSKQPLDISSEPSAE